MLLSELLSKSEDAVHKLEKKKKRKLAESSCSIKNEKKNKVLHFGKVLKKNLNYKAKYICVSLGVHMQQSLCSCEAQRTLEDMCFPLIEVGYLVSAVEMHASGHFSCCSFLSHSRRAGITATWHCVFWGLNFIVSFIWSVLLPTKHLAGFSQKNIISETIFHKGKMQRIYGSKEKKRSKTTTNRLF